MYVLIVDDDALLRKVLTEMVQDAGHTTCWSATGEGALKLMRREKPDVVVLDINLGDGLMSGWDVLREKLLDERVRHIPVVVLSGLHVEQIREGAKVVDDALSGAMIILGKPVSMDLLLTALKRIENPAAPSPGDSLSDDDVEAITRED